MSKHPFLRAYGLAFAVTIAGAIGVACGGGGGGGGSSLPPTGGGGGTTPTPTATPVATQSPSSNPASVTGHIVDDAGSPIAGATVSFGTGFGYVPSGAITGVVKTATTDANGNFAATLTVGSASYVEVDASGHASAHKIVSLTAGTDALPTWTLPVPNADEQAGLSALNSDRASQGNGAGAQPVTLDADMMIVARYRANDMATQGYFAHTAPGQTVSAVYAEWQTLPDNLSSITALFGVENIAAGPSSIAAAENAWVYQDASAGNSHRNAALSKGNIWVGFGAAYNGKSYVQGGAPVSYLAEVFVTTCGTACP